MSGCSEGSDMRFPELDVVKPLLVVKINVHPEELICEIDDIEKIREFVAQLSNTYNTGWSRVRVSLAPEYQLTMGKTEILILEHGLAIRIPQNNGESMTLGHGFAENSAERLINAICLDGANQ